MKFLIASSVFRQILASMFIGFCPLTFTSCVSHETRRPIPPESIPASAWHIGDRGLVMKELFVINQTYSGPTLRVPSREGPREYWNDYVKSKFLGTLQEGDRLEIVRCYYNPDSLSGVNRVTARIISGNLQGLEVEGIGLDEFYATPIKGRLGPRYPAPDDRWVKRTSCPHGSRR